MDSPPDDQVLTRYVAEEASAEERAQVEAWLAADPNRRARLEQLRCLWEDVRKADPRPEARWEPEREWNRLARRLGIFEEGGGADEPKPRPPRGPVRRGGWRTRRRRAASPRARHGRWRRVAAGMLAGLLVVAVAALVLTRGGRLPWTDAADAPAEAVYTTATGERAEVRLTDGTAVELAPESRLTVAFDAGTGRRRRVRLAGRGFFEVARDTTRPFVVQTENATVRVLGTAFDVRTYKGAGASQVVVAEGRVAVRLSDGRGRPAGSSVALEAKQRARLSAEGRLEVSAARSLKAHMAWMGGRLAFRDAPLREVLRRLERWHDFKGRIADSSLARRPLTAAFGGSAPLEETLNALALAVKARYERTGPNTYTFHRSSRAD